jgi:hypothetical protein
MEATKVSTLQEAHTNYSHIYIKLRFKKQNDVKSNIFRIRIPVNTAKSLKCSLSEIAVDIHLRK